MRLSNILLFHLKLIDHYYRIVGLYYEDQKEAALERAKDFRENRVPKFFKHFESVLSSNKESGGEWLIGDSITYADLALFHLVDGVSIILTVIITFDYRSY